MSYFAAVLARAGDGWTGSDIDLAECESLDDAVDMLRDTDGDVRVLMIEEDDEYAAIIRLDAADDDPRAFLSDGHAADRFAIAALIAEGLIEAGGVSLAGDDLDDGDVPAARDSAPCGDLDIVDDLGTPAADLLAMCEHPGTLPVDLLLAVCEKAGCAETFENLRG